MPLFYHCFGISSFVGSWIVIEGPQMKQIDTGLTSDVFALSERGEVYSLDANKKWKEIDRKGISFTYVSVGGSGESMI